MTTRPSTSDMWQACLRKDAAFDGIFVLAVKTTGIFCRPSCRARKPLRENVEFFATPREAVVAGYRPCKRCRPHAGSASAPAWVQDLLTRVEGATGRRMTDADLRAMSIEPTRARRYFKEHFGMTFQAYQRSRRLGSALTHLRRGSDLDRVGLAHGFESASGFRDAFERLFGAPPGRGRSADCLRLQWVETPLGPFIAAATTQGLSMFEFADRRALPAQITSLRRRYALPAVPGTNEHLEQVLDEVDRYFAGALRQFAVALDVRGTLFQEKVWRGLREIPYGETTSYERIAGAIGHPAACRAVGRANGQNRIAVIIPCHRVIGSDGRLCGYGGGLWRKQFLLDLESGSPQAAGNGAAPERRAAPALPGRGNGISCGTLQPA